METINRKKLLIVLCVVTAALTSLFCLFTPVKEHTIFSIPTGTLPEKLEEEGFSLGYRRVFNQPLDQIEYAWLALGEYHTMVEFDAEGRWENYHITMNAATFYELTGKQPKSYAALEVDGYTYRVRCDRRELVLERLGI